MKDIINSYDKKILSRYMPYEYLLDILDNDRLALLKPERWGDKNDTSALTHYKDTKRITSLYAACFTQASETYHHWQVYGKKEAVRIIFNRDLLLDSIRNNDEYLFGEVDYVLVNNFKKTVTDINRLPFVKRYPYRDEDEFRILRKSDLDNGDIHYLPLPYNCITQISIGYGLTPDRFLSIKKAIKAKCKYEIKVYKTTVLENKPWIKMVKSLA